MASDFDKHLPPIHRPRELPNTDLDPSVTDGVQPMGRPYLQSQVSSRSMKAIIQPIPRIGSLRCHQILPPEEQNLAGGSGPSAGPKTPFGHRHILYITVISFLIFCRLSGLIFCRLEQMVPQRCHVDAKRTGTQRSLNVERAVHSSKGHGQKSHMTMGKFQTRTWNNPDKKQRNKNNQKQQAQDAPSVHVESRMSDPLHVTAS